MADPVVPPPDEKRPYVAPIETQASSNAKPMRTTTNFEETKSVVPLPEQHNEAAVQAVAEVLLADYSSEYDNRFDWTEFRSQAERVLAAAMPHIRAQLADEIDREAEHENDPHLNNFGKARASGFTQAIAIVRGGLDV